MSGVVVRDGWSENVVVRGERETRDVVMRVVECEVYW